MAYIDGEQRAQHTLFPVILDELIPESCLPCDRGVCGPVGHGEAGFCSLRRLRPDVLVTTRAIS